MPKAKPEVQWTMNNTLGAIGIHHATIELEWAGEECGLQHH